MLNGRFVGALALIGTGAAALLFAVVADALGVGTKGVGLRQWLLAIGGAVVLVAGVYTTSGGRAWMTRFASNDPPLSLGEGVWLGVWFGLVTGLFEIGHQVVRKVVFGELIKQPEHIVWMAPLSFVIMFVVLAIGLGLLRSVVPAITLRVLVFCIVFLAGWGQLIMHPVIDGGSGLLLAAGFAGYVARAAATNAGRLRRLCRVTLPWLAGAIAVAGMAIPVWNSMAEQRAIDALPEARAGDPNVLLIVLDTVRADHLGVYGYRRDTTPNLSRLAETGVVFEWPIVPCSWTLPTHATFFTGRYPFEHGADWLVPLDDKYPTLAEGLAGRGYATGGFVGNLAFCLREHGVARGFQRYEDFYVNPTVMSFSTALGAYLTLGGRFREAECVPCLGLRNNAPTITRQFLSWLDEIEGEERPFFAFLNYFDAHLRYEPQPPYDTMFRGDGLSINPKMQRLVDDYDACIAYIDEHVGKILDDLRERDLLENTLVIITGDHGELFDEHDLRGHANSLYRPLVHCPLVVRPPGGTDATRIADVVSLRDLPATILEIAGYGDDSAIPGHSLTPFWRGSGDTGPAARSPALAEVSAGINLDPALPVSKGPMKSLIADGLQYIRNGDGTEEIYELAEDPMREQNLIDTPAGAAAAARLRQEVDRILRR